MKNIFVVTLLLISSVHLHGAQQPPGDAADLEKEFMNLIKQDAHVVATRGSTLLSVVPHKYYGLGQKALMNILKNAPSILPQGVTMKTPTLRFPYGWEEQYKNHGVGAGASVGGIRKLPDIHLLFTSAIQSKIHEKGTIAQLAHASADHKRMKERAMSCDDPSHPEVLARKPHPTITISSFSSPPTPAQGYRSTPQTAPLAVAHVTPQTPGETSAPPNTPSALSCKTPVPTPLKIGALTIFSPTSVTSSGSNP